MHDPRRIARWLNRLAGNIRQRSAMKLEKPRLGYIGWLGKENLGDEAMFVAARRCYPNHAMVHMDLPAMETALARLGLSGRAYFDGVILGGGTLISPYWTPSVRLPQQWNVPVWSLGTGVGSSGFEEAQEVDLGPWKELLPRFKAMGLRGPRSLARARALGAGDAAVIGDLALSFALDRPEPPADAPRFMVNVALPAGERYAAETVEWQNELQRAVIRLVRQGWEPVGVAMHTNDVAPLEQLLRACGRPVMVHRPATVDAFFQLVRPCRMTLAVRLHGAILSACAGVPPLMIGYRDKCLDFMESVGLEEWHIDPLSGAGEIAARVQDLTLASAERRKSTLVAAQSLRDSFTGYVQRTGGLLSAEDGRRHAAHTLK